MAKGTEIFSKIPKTEYTEDLLPVDGVNFDHVIKNRRSVRVYTDEVVPETVVKKALEHALLAPNSSNLQAWEFYWVKSPEKKSLLVEACFGQPAAKTAPVLVVAVARPDHWKKHAKQMISVFDQSTFRVPDSARAYYQKLAPLLYTQGFLSLFGYLKKVAFFFIGFFKKVPRGPHSNSDLEAWAHKTVALGCENFMLSLSSEGYDSCPMEGFDEVAVKKLLKLPHRARVTMVMSGGKRAKVGVYGPRVRFPTHQFIKEV
ncbi:MAG: nitroreductase family protein [Bacteriovoracaceae bacterium]